MSLLAYEYKVMDRLMPSLREELIRTGYQTLEESEGLGYSLFKEHSGCGVLLPEAYQGKGATALDAVALQLAMGSLSPSLAIGTTMHQYKVVTLAEMNTNGLLNRLLTDIVDNKWLVASGGSEGIPGQNLFNPQMQAKDVKGGIEVTGTKRPCSISRSMDLLSVMIKSEDDSIYGGELLNVIVDPNHSTVTRERFFHNPVLGNTESDSITLNNTPVSESYIFPLGSLSSVKPFTNVAFLWFELLATASYLGMASRLIQMAVDTRDKAVVRLSEVIINFETHRMALQYLAIQMDSDDRSDSLLAKTLNVRYNVQKAIVEMTSTCFELLGGLSFVQSTEAQNIMIASRALCFHPPGKSLMEENIVSQAQGNEFSLA